MRTAEHNFGNRQSQYTAMNQEGDEGNGFFPLEIEEDAKAIENATYWQIFRIKSYRFLYHDNYYNARRLVLFHLSTLCYNAYTTALYYNSINEFPQHAQGPDGKNLLDTRISKIKYSEHHWVPAPLTFLAAFCAVLFYSNQRTFPKRLKKLFNRYYREEEEKKEKGESWTMTDKLIMFDSFVSASFKTATTSSSLFALQSNVFSALCEDKEASFIMAILGTSVFFLGNFFAQFSVFLEHFLEDVTLCSKFPQARKKLSHYFAASYAISNAALYFNAFDAAPKHIAWIENRLTHPETPSEAIALVAGIIMSISFIYATWKRFQERIDNLISGSSEPEATPVNSSRPASYHSINGDNLDTRHVFDHQDIRLHHKLKPISHSVAAAWKTIVTTGSILGLIANNSDVMENPNKAAGVACFLTVTTFLSFFPQLSLYARSNETIIKDELKERIPSNRGNGSLINEERDANENSHNIAGFFYQTMRQAAPNCCIPSASHTT